MSADSPRRGLHKGARVISPQQISDRSIVDSVAGIINDIVPQAYTGGAPHSDNKESITWARFEYADVNDSALYPDYVEGSATPPLLLVLGYATGVQVWVVAASGEATEVLSWRQGIVRTLRILPDPKTDEDRADPFEAKRPMVAICDSAGSGSQFCSVSFVSLRTGDQTKSIKFKNPVCDILANKRSVVVTFSEKIAVFDARTLEDVLTVTTCYPSPGPNPNPVALGTRWLAYSEKKLLPARRSSGGSEGEGVQSYTAAVLYAAKSLGKGLRGLGETVASSLTGNSVVTPSSATSNNIGVDATQQQPGVVTILDLQAAKEEKELDDPTIETVVAHFTAHNDAIVAMTFDLTGALLMTADRRGHDFHVFRIQPHPGGPSLAAVHHLYVLHRGDTTAKVQDMTFSSDTRWAAVSTVRGTTHVFPVAPYGGPVGIRTHSTPHVVNRLSRFHRSAGLTDDAARSHSPVSHPELPLSAAYPYSNPRLPPYPHPTILHPLAQIRQPSALNHGGGQSQSSRPQQQQHQHQHPHHQQRQRLHSDDSGTLPLKICACFAPPRAWIYAQRDSTNKIAKRAVDSLFVMACHGNMIQYDLEPKPAAGVPKEKVCDDTTIELEVEAKGQWPLLRTPNSLEIVPPLSSSNPLLCASGSPKSSRQLPDAADDRWLSQVEIVTHAGPHRRLWMGPQFVFKTYNAPSGVNLIESEAIEIGVTGGSRPARSNPVNMPHAAARPLVPVVIDGSGSSYEQSPRFVEAYGGDSLDNESMGMGNGENQLREDLAEAMLETSTAPHRVPGRRLVVERVGQPVTKVVNPLGTVITVLADEEDVSSSREFDDATPEPPRSVCAEEGPASLGDFDTEVGEELRNLTEICAEMRSASEPAIDSVPDDSIKEVTERKTLCAEAATTTNTSAGPGNTIDFERIEAFRDVPTSLSLCAEKGEIPNSPMTQARENTWIKRSAKREDSEQQERTFAKAKYVVNYDEDSVVLMEKVGGNGNNRAPIYSARRGRGSQRLESAPRELEAAPATAEPERASKRPPPSKLSSNSRATKRSVSGITSEQPKYLVREDEDSVVIEDATMMGAAGEKGRGEGNGNSCNEGTASDKAISEEQRTCYKNVKLLDTISGEVMLVEPQPILDATPEVSLSSVEEAMIDPTLESDFEPMEATIATGLAALPSEPPPLDDVTCMDYHIVESTTIIAPLKEQPVYSHQSDDDIEHIHSSEVRQILDIVESERISDNCRKDDGFVVSPMRQRKSSKSTISDDDLEHIQSCELGEVPEASVATTTTTLAIAVKPNDGNDRNGSEKVVAKATKSSSSSILSFDEDIEHVCYSELSELVEPVVSKVVATEKKVEETRGIEDGTGSGSIRSRGSRKRKDVVVIDSDASEAEVTVIVKSLEDWNKSKTTEEKDLVEEIDRCVEIKDPSTVTERTSSSLSLPKKTRVRTGKVAASGSANVQKRQSQPQQQQQQQQQPPPSSSSSSSSSSDMIEIIDIDAMQKAEMEVASECIVAPPECKILEPRHDHPQNSRTQKSRRTKKAHLESTANPGNSPGLVVSMETQTVLGTKANSRENEEDNIVDEIGNQSSMSWSWVVKKPDVVVVVVESESNRDNNSSDLEPISQPSQIDASLTVGSDNETSLPETNDGNTVATVQLEEPRNATNQSQTANSRSSNSEVSVKAAGSKKRGKKTRLSGTENSAESSEKSPVVQLASIVESLSPTKETSTRRGARSRGKQQQQQSSQVATPPITLVNEDKLTLESEEAESKSYAAVAMVDEPPSSSLPPSPPPLPSKEHTPVSSPKETLPEPEQELEVERTAETEEEKRTDSDQDAGAERSSSSDELNANVVPMDTEEDTAVRELTEKNNSNHSSPSWSTVNKKNTRSKKKRHR